MSKAEVVMFEQLTIRQITNISRKLVRYGYTQEEADRFLSDESTDVRYPEWLKRDRQQRHDRQHHPVLHQICGDSCGDD
ncbi:MAG: hypothetical protein WAZ27_02620 [Minisyncoccia bacterium]